MEIRRSIRNIAFQESAMTMKEVNKQVREMEKFAQEIRKSPAKAREFLYGTGMYTKAGNLKKQFR